MSSSVPVSTIFLRLGKAYHVATNAFEAITGVSAARWRLIYLVGCQPGISQRALVRQVKVDPGSITRQLTSLQADGLIERREDTQDARVLRLRLTARGRREVARVMRIRAEFLQTMVQGVPETDLHVAARVLDRMSLNLGDDTPLPTGLEDLPAASRKRA
jgi:DNA-binding MarR family transcriptional regulator